LRDVGEDALRGRIYLPIEDLQKHDVRAHEVLNRIDSERFQGLMNDLCAYTHGLYDKALALLPEADRRAQKPGLMMCSIYRTLLREMATAGFPVLRERVALTPLRKFWLAWKMQALGRF
jgi:phytoene synthase